MKNELPNDTKGLKKAKSKLDKVLLGVVVGGAVGSILGITLTSKKGRDARKKMEQKGRETWEKISRVIDEKKGEEEEKGESGFWHFLNRTFMKNKNKDE